MNPDADALDVDRAMAELGEDDEMVFRGCSAELPGRGLSRLFVSEVASEEDGAGVWAFGAVVAEDESQVRFLLEARYGAVIAASSIVREGFDGSTGMARSLVSPALAETLGAVASDPSSPLARGFEILIEQRFYA